ncbi:MAG: hypothetical protein BroJett011_63750 [Chloroflexota bacterium]|nr:MAG: hypothetical protein BroJett011_63750 [Chloroflexota bacterium]
MIEYQGSIRTTHSRLASTPVEARTTLEEETTPERSFLALLERIMGSSATAPQKWTPAPPPSFGSNGEALLAQFDSLEITPPHLTLLREALLVYAALENAATAVEAERRRLAALLQSNVAESLNLLLSQPKTYEQTLGANSTMHNIALSMLTSLARQVLQQVHNLETNFYRTVLETLGLESALEALTNQEMRDHSVEIGLVLERMHERLPAQIELALFRVTQDTIYCAIRQAHASQVSICLKRCDGQLIFNLADNGILVTGEEILPTTRQRIQQLDGAIETRIGRRQGFELTISFAIEAPIQLTSREAEVLQLLTEGFSNKEIARLLTVSPRTVNFHLDNIYSKLGASSRTEAVIYALRRGWTRHKVTKS